MDAYTKINCYPAIQIATLILIVVINLLFSIFGTIIIAWLIKKRRRDNSIQNRESLLFHVGGSDVNSLISVKKSPTQSEEKNILGNITNTNNYDINNDKMSTTSFVTDNSDYGHKRGPLKQQTSEGEPVYSTASFKEKSKSLQGQTSEEHIYEDGNLYNTPTSTKTNLTQTDEQTEDAHYAEIDSELVTEETAAVSSNTSTSATLNIYDTLEIKEVILSTEQTNV